MPESTPDRVRKIDEFIAKEVGTGNSRGTLDVSYPEGDIAVIRLHGFLDARTLSRIEEAFVSLTSQPGIRAVVDLTGVSNVTTPALAMFVDAAQQARSTGGKLIFTESQPDVRYIMQRLHLHAILRTMRDLSQAIQEARS